MKRQRWEKLGEVGVDAGLIWVGDPCYVFHKELPPSELGSSWTEFCEILGETQSKQFGNGFGVCVGTAFGDGTYPVLGRIEGGRIMEVRVVFDGSANDLDDQD